MPENEYEWWQRWAIENPWGAVVVAVVIACAVALPLIFIAAFQK